MKRYLKKTVLFLLTGLFAVCAGIAGLPGRTVFAEEINPEAKGSITVTMRESETRKPVRGGELTLYQAAVAVKNNADFSFRGTESFSESGVIFESLDSGELASPELAERLSEYAERKGLNGFSVTVDETGTAVFPSLEQGLYLVVQTKTAGGYNVVSPFLISVPMKGEDGESWIYDVDAAPKVELYTEKPEIPSKPNVPDNPKIPWTGQLEWPVPVLTAVGLLLFAAGWVLKFGKRDEGHEK